MVLGAPKISLVLGGGVQKIGAFGDKEGPCSLGRNLLEQVWGREAVASPLWGWGSRAQGLLPGNTS